MKKLKFLISVPDKHTGKQYEAGQVYEFEDKRADEILAARTAVTKPYRSAPTIGVRILGP